ncbi:MAG TPA: glycosyltransferase family 2 protein [Dissulfurispiraceae bacterium]|nr:glycosyltransferase family 2 protein [Dissulfurispiraceae bacterium]
MLSPAITVIIVNLNGERYLGDCLASLASQTFMDFEVIVVDNGSTDDSLALIGKHFPWVRVLPLRENTGFAKGNNIGFAASSSKYMVTMNNDTIADGCWLKALFDAAESDASVGLVASKIYLGRDGTELDSAGMLIYPDGMSRQRGRGEKDAGQFDGIREVLFPSACAALYRSEMLKDIGCFDEDFFSYCEDADLGLRARLAGWKAVFAPQATVRHLYSQTGGKYSGFKAYHIERNRFWLLLKDLPVSYILLFPVYTLWRYTVQVYGLLSGKGSVARFAEDGGGPKKLISAAFRAWCGALRGLPGTIGKRKRIWRSKRLTIREYKNLLKMNSISATELMLRD